MKTSYILHYAFRARDPERMAYFYADVFEGQFFLHPVMTPLGIMIVKINHPRAIFNGLLEFWPWNVIWDSEGAVFRKVDPKPSPTSYGHLAVKVLGTSEEILAELQRKGIPHRMEPRGPDLMIPTLDDPEGNMVELFPNIDTMDLPPQALVPPAQAGEALAALRRRFREATAHYAHDQGYPLHLL